MDERLSSCWLGLILLVLLAVNSVAAQPTRPENDSFGVPVVRSFVPQAYDGNGEVWDIAQDGRGLLYIASSYGLQQYDGARWRALPTGNETTPWVIARDTAGTLYVGARNELGVYRPDSLGRLTYRSLVDRVPVAHRPVGNVRDVVASQGDLYFRTQGGVLRWDQGRTADSMQAVTDTAVLGLFGCRGAAYVQRADGIVAHVRGARLSPVEGAERVRTAAVQEIIREAGPEGCEIVTAEKGRFGLEEEGLHRRPWPGGPMPASIAHAVRGPGGGLAVATDTTIRLVGPRGRRQHLTQAHDLPDGNVQRLHVSTRGALWVATRDGPARVAWPDPVSVVDAPAAIRSTIDAFERHNGRLAVATERGVWQARGSGEDTTLTSQRAFDLLSTEAGLLIAGTDDLLVWRDGMLRTVAEGRSYALHRSPRDSSIVFVSRYDEGLFRLRLQRGEWHVADRTDRIATPIYTLAQDTSGALWMGTGHRGILRLRSPLGDLDVAPLARFDTTDGLPDGHFNYTVQLDDSVGVITDDGLYRFRRSDRTFVPDVRFAPVYADGVGNGWPYVPGLDGEVWIDFGGHKFGVARPAGDSVQWRTRAFRRLADLGDVNAIYPHRVRDSLVWLAAEHGMVRYDRVLKRFGGHAYPFHTLIRGVQTRDDSILYGGDTGTETLPAPIGSEHDALRFQFGATSYEQIDGPTHNWDRPRQYRWRLSGADDHWTDWTTEPQADYTNLPPGSHTLRVQSRNLYRTVGTEAQLSFTVRSPWYRTWWAYGLYALLAATLVGGAVQWRTRRLRRRQEVLEQTVAERTEQIRQKNDRLARQAEHLQELDEAKSRFFANITHEFRTPLTLIQGPIREVREHLQRGRLEAVPADADADAEQLAIAERNTARLQRLIDQILGLARLDAGTYDIAAGPTDLADETRRIVRRFTPTAEEAGLTLTVDTDEEPKHGAPPVYVDREAWEHVLSNLLSNAVKFTPEGGQVRVRIAERTDAVTVIVSDTGPGIPEVERDTVFDRFAQVDDTSTREQEGTGIGLAFASDLVELHGGTIEVESAEGEGTAFTVRLPRGPDHLSDDQCADAPAPSPSEEDPSERQTSSSDAPSLTGPRSSPLASSVSSRDETSEEETAPDHDSAFHAPNSKLVLVVDDNADVRQYVRSVLEPAFTVLEAADGEEGATMAREHLPDVILADVMMPGMDGHEMTRRLKDDLETEAIPVIMVTARVETRDEVEGLRVGADDYVTKPFDADVLRQRVGGVLTLQHRLRRRLEAELQEAEESDDPVPEERPEIVREVRWVAREHLTDSDFDVEALAGKMAMSRSTLYRKLNDASDHTPSSLLRTVRIEQACDLLEAGERVTQVAYAVGYDTLSTFSRVFREEVGIPPSTYAEEAA